MKTVLSYRILSEAETDKSMLESHDIMVRLVYSTDVIVVDGIQLQVLDGQFDKAVFILNELHPERFGSPETVKEIEAGIKQAFFKFILLYIACAALLCSLLGSISSFLTRVGLSLFLGLGCAGFIFIIYLVFWPRKKRKT
jgi:hypothetical protein